MRSSMSPRHQAIRLSMSPQWSGARHLSRTFCNLEIEHFYKEMHLVAMVVCCKYIHRSFPIILYRLHFLTLELIVDFKMDNMKFRRKHHKKLFAFALNSS